MKLNLNELSGVYKMTNKIKLTEVVALIAAEFKATPAKEVIKNQFNPEHKAIRKLVEDAYSVSEDISYTLLQVAYGFYGKEHYIERQANAEQRLQYADSYQAGSWDREDIKYYSDINHFLKHNVE
jgi:hypothetical protein